MNISPTDLKRVVVFQNATNDDLQLILQNSITRSIEEGGFFFFQGDPAQFLYVLTSGQAKLMQTSSTGQQVSLRMLYPWQMFGALGAVRTEATYPASAQALENSTALASKASTEIVREKGQEISITFTVPNKDGLLEYYDSVGNHVKLGLRCS